MISLHEALDRLLHHRGYRQAFLDDRWEELDLDPTDWPHLETIDRTQLQRAAAGIAKDLLARKHRGCGGLAVAFEKSLAHWQEAQGKHADIEELIYRFLESPAYDDYKELAVGEPGLCVEEAFYRFALREGIGPRAMLEREYLTAGIKAVSMEPAHAFRLPAGLRRRGRLLFAVQYEDETDPTLFASVAGQFIHGKVSPLVAGLIEAEGVQQRRAVGNAAGLAREQIARLEAGLAQRGLISYGE